MKSSHIAAVLVDAAPYSRPSAAGSSSSKHDVKEITCQWRQFLGSELVLHYSVTDGKDLYELAYNATRQVWVLENLDTG